MKLLSRLLLVFIGFSFLSYCSLIGGGSDPEEYTLSTSAEPVEGGSVSPNSGSYEEGNEVTVTATAAEGWIFSNWTGTGITSSSANPYSFEIKENTTITGLFSATSSIYDMELELADPDNSISINFGQIKEGTSEFDDGHDMESPPPPPPGALHAFFQNGSMELLKDYRNYLRESETWDLAVQTGSQSTTLSWAINETRLVGTITLLSEDGTVDINMLENSSLDIPPNSDITYTISYHLN